MIDLPLSLLSRRFQVIAEKLSALLRVPRDDASGGDGGDGSAALKASQKFWKRVIDPASGASAEHVARFLLDATHSDLTVTHSR